MAAGERPGWQLGCNTVLFGGFDLDTALQHIAWAGYDGAELAAIPGMAEHAVPGRGPEHAAELREKASRYGLSLLAMEAATNLAQPENRARLVAAFDLAREAGIPVVTTGSSGKARDEESLQQAIGWIRELAAAAGERGVRYAVKPHVGSAVYNTETALRLVEAVDHPALGLNYDPTHLIREGDDPVEAARRLGPHIIHVHIRDVGSRDPRMGPPEVQIAGRGILDLPAILRTLWEVGYRGALDLEIIGAVKYELGRCMGIAAESRGYFHRCLQEIGVRPLGATNG